MARKDNDDNDSGGGALTGSTVWWGAGGLIVLVLIGLVWILISDNGPAPTATPTRTVTAAPPGSSTPGSLSPRAPASTSVSPAAGDCNVPGGTSAVPTSPIPATWQAVGAVAAPVSSTAGPKKVTGPGGTLRSCYQHSPTGAVIAAMNIIIAGTSSNEQQVIEQGFTPGPGRTEAQQQPADSGGGSIAGFQAQACTQSTCLVKIAISVQGLTIEQTVPMIWTNGDWKVNGQVTGVAQPVQVTSLSPYVAMSPNGSSS